MMLIHGQAPARRRSKLGGYGSKTDRFLCLYGFIVDLLIVILNLISVSPVTG